MKTKKVKEETDLITRAIGILQFIPKDKFITGKIANEDNTMCCSIGWLAQRICHDAKKGTCCPIVLSIAKKVEEFNGFENRGINLADINDNAVRTKYSNIDNPKDRVLAVLRDIKKQEQLNPTI